MRSAASSRAPSRATCSRSRSRPGCSASSTPRPSSCPATSGSSPTTSPSGLSQHDHDKLAPYAATLTRSWPTELRNHAREMGYVFNGPDPDRLRARHQPADRPVHRGLRGRGRGRASTSALGPACRGSGTPRPPRAAGCRRGSRSSWSSRSTAPATRCEPPGLVIGRGTEADLRINDPGISRRHAEIRVSGRAATRSTSSTSARPTASWSTGRRCGTRSCTRASGSRSGRPGCWSTHPAGR